MQAPWQPAQPIWLQLRDRLVAQILDQRLQGGDPLPSVRALAGEFSLNPLTVHRALRALADAGVVVRRRGQAMALADGAPARLIAAGRRQFIEQEWPGIAAKLRRLGLSAAGL